MPLHAFAPWRENFRFGSHGTLTVSIRIVKSNPAPGVSKYIEKQGFLAEAVKFSSTANPLSGEEVEKIVAGLFKLKPALIAKMADILK